MSVLRRLRSASAAVALACIAAAAPVEAAEQPAVVVSSKPAHALAAAVLRGVADPKLLVEGQASPHSYVMKPSDARALNGAKLFIRISERLEPFTAKVVGALPRSVAVLTLAEAKGLTLLPARAAGVLAALDAHAHDHDEGHRADGHGTSGSAATDPHIWLDPANAQAMVTAMVPSLTRLYPASADAISANAAALQRELLGLESELAATMTSARGRRYLALHDAYQYFEHRYGLVAVGTIAVTPEDQAGARRLSELRGLVGSLGPSCVFAEPVGEQRLVATLVEGTSARVVRLDPEGLLLAPGPDLYAVLMRNLARDMAGCLAPPTP